MRYHIEFHGNGRRFAFDGTKYMQRNASAANRIADILQDYTTLYCHVTELLAGGSAKELGTAYLKFRTFENLAATGSLADFLISFRITGTADPVTQLQARMRFIAFTAQFVQREFDPLALPASTSII
jgi:hypothetical protein